MPREYDSLHRRALGFTLIGVSGQVLPNCDKEAVIPYTGTTRR